MHALIKANYPANCLTDLVNQGMGLQSLQSANGTLLAADSAVQHLYLPGLIVLKYCEYMSPHDTTSMTTTNRSSHDTFKPIFPLENLSIMVFAEYVYIGNGPLMRKTQQNLLQTSKHLK